MVEQLNSPSLLMLNGRQFPSNQTTETTVRKMRQITTMAEALATSSQIVGQDSVRVGLVSRYRSERIVAEESWKGLAEKL